MQYQPRKSNCKSKWTLPLFHHKLQQAIVRVAMKDAPVIRLCNNEDLALKAKLNRAKEEMIKTKNMEKATEEYIEGMFYP
jgi:hypothetical protein